MKNVNIELNNNSKKLTIFRIVGYSIFLISTIIFAIFSVFIFPNKADSNNVGEQVGEATGIILGVTFQMMFAGGYALVNIPTLILGLLCMIKDVRNKNGKLYALDLGLIVLPTIAVVLGIIIPILLMQKL